MGKMGFFDDDLIRERDTVREVRFGPGNEPPSDDDVPVSDTVPVRELDLVPLAQRKEEINGMVAGKLEELERLRARQDSLEREKSDLEQLRVDQEKYDLGKREMVDQVDQCLVSLEREEIALNQRYEVLQGTQKNFKAMSAQLREIREDQWPQSSGGYRAELSKGLAVLDNMRKEYHQALSRLDAVRDLKVGRTKEQTLMAGDFSGARSQRRSFGEWLLIGLAFNLPLFLVLAVLAVLVALQHFPI